MVIKSKSENKLDVRNLAVLADEEVAALGELQITKWQEIKGGSFKESIEAWQYGATDQILGMCFLLENCPIGMTLFKRPPLSPAWACADAATIHGLKIAIPWQGRGFGHKAFELAVVHLKKEWPSISKLMLAVDADNAAAIAVYRAFGMSKSESSYQGPAGPEYRFEMQLNA